MATTSTSTQKQPRQRVPASERRAALIEAAVHEFAHSGLHGTPVDRIARRVGVAQPYVFSLFENKRELFLAAVERGFELIGDTFARAAEEFDPATAPPDVDVLKALGAAYVELLATHRDYLMLQLQSYSACDDEEICRVVRQGYGDLVAYVERVSGLGPTAVSTFFAKGMLLNVFASMGLFVEQAEPWAERLLGGCKDSVS